MDHDPLKAQRERERKVTDRAIKALLRRDATTDYRLIWLIPVGGGLAGLGLIGLGLVGLDWELVEKIGILGGMYGVILFYGRILGLGILGAAVLGLGTLGAGLLGKSVSGVVILGGTALVLLSVLWFAWCGANADPDEGW